MSSVAYNNGKAALLKEDLDTVTLKAMLMNVAYTPDVDADVYVSDISADRAAGSTDITLASVAVSVNNTNDKAQLDCADFTTGTVTVTTNAYVVYISTGVDSTSQLLGYIELTDGVTTPKTFSVVSGVLSVTIPATGFLTL